MTKTICINQKHFTQGLGYGLWGLLTFGLLLFMIASIVEFDSQIYVQGERFSSSKTCITNFFDGEQQCSRYYQDQWEIRNNVSIIFVITDFIVIGLWIYHKQQKVKFSWCLNGVKK